MMICKHCSFENEDGEKVCKACGEPLEQDLQQPDAAAGSSEETSIEQMATDDADIQDVRDEELPVFTEAGMPDGEDAQPEEAEDDAAFFDEKPDNESKKRPFFFAFSGIIALAAICLGMWLLFTGIFAPKYELPVDRSKFDLLYIKDDMLYAKPISKAVRQLSDAMSASSEYPVMSDSGTIVQSKDGKTTYFLENYDSETMQGSLFVSYNNKDKVHIADGVIQGFTVSPDGKSVLYLTNADLEQGSGTLNFYKKGGQVQVLAEKSAYNVYLFADDSKAVGYIDNYDNASYSGELYYMPVDGQAVKVDDGVVILKKLSSKREIIYLKDMNMQDYTCDLYCWSSVGGSELIVEDINQNYMNVSPFSAKTIYLKTPDNITLDFVTKVPNKPAQIIMSGLMGFFSYDIENGNYLLAKAPEDDSRTPDMYLNKKGREPVKIAEKFVAQQHGKASLDYSRVVYLNEYDQATNRGKLHVRTNWFGLIKDRVIAENVFVFALTPDAKTIAYLADTDEKGAGSLYVYRGGKSQHIADGLMYQDFILSQNGKAIFYMTDIDAQTNTGNLYMIRTYGGGPMQIDSGVYSDFYSRSDKNIIYMKNYDSETQKSDLYMWKGFGDPEQLDTGVGALLFETKIQ